MFFIENPITSSALHFDIFIRSESEGGGGDYGIKDANDLKHFFSPY